MSLSEKELWELGELTSAAADGWISDAQRARLEEILSSSEEARKHYLRLSSISAGAAWIAHAEAPASRVWTPRRVNFRRSYWAGWAAAAVLAIVAGGAWFKSHPQAAPNKVATTWAQNTDPGVAVLNDAYDVEWADAQEPSHVGNVLKPGPLRLKSGVAQIQFLNGVNVLMEGPAELELLSASEGRCTSGKVLVDVPGDAHGFRLHAPYMASANPGTGFGVDVNQGQGAIHVFRGQVEISSHGAAPTPLEAGSALRFDHSGAFKPMAANLQDFNPPMPAGSWGRFEGFGPPGPGFGMEGFGGPGMGFPGAGPGFFPGPGGPPGYGGFGGFFGNSGRWKGFDPLESVRWQLHASEDRWGEIGPAVAAYLDAQRNVYGNQVMVAQLVLSQTQSDPSATDDDVGRRIRELHTAKDQARQVLEQARAALTGKLTTWEEAELVSSGVLQ